MSSSSPFDPNATFAPPAFADEPDDEIDDDLDEFDDEEEETDEAVGNEAPGNEAPGNEAANRGGDAANLVVGGTARAVLEHIARSIVDEADAVHVEVGEGRSGVKLSLHVAPSDMGRIIGKRGRVAQAIRSVVRAAAARDGSDASVDIVD